MGFVVEVVKGIKFVYLINLIELKWLFVEWGVEKIGILVWFCEVVVNIEGCINVGVWLVGGLCWDGVDLVDKVMLDCRVEVLERSGWSCLVIFVVIFVIIWFRNLVGKIGFEGVLFIFLCVEIKWLVVWGVGFVLEEEGVCFVVFWFVGRRRVGVC